MDYKKVFDGNLRDIVFILNFPISIILLLEDKLKRKQDLCLNALDELRKCSWCSDEDSNNYLMRLNKWNEIGEKMMKKFGVN